MSSADIGRKPSIYLAKCNERSRSAVLDCVVMGLEKSRDAGCLRLQIFFRISPFVGVREGELV